jgi:crossover junction endodeoxyribonuclease RuvC
LRVIGFDPGLALLGYGVVDVRGGGGQVLVECGVVKTASGLSLPRRLGLIYTSASELVEAFAPDAVAVEELFFNTNVKTALAVGQARGALLSAVIRHTDAIYEYTPLQVKQAVTGYGRADKHQVQQMVKALLRLRDVPRPDDAADAVAVALCHATTVRLRAAVESTK